MADSSASKSCSTKRYPLQQVAAQLAFIFAFFVPSLTFAQLEDSIGYVTGKIVDADTGQAVAYPAPIYIQSCDNAVCTSVQIAGVDANGNFEFPPEPDIKAGRYRVQIAIQSPANYYPVNTEQIDIGVGQDFDFGVIRVKRAAAIGSIRGTLVRQDDGRSLADLGQIILQRCSDETGCRDLARTATNDAGRFVFASRADLTVNFRYRVRIEPELARFSDTSTGYFELNANEHYDLGEIPVPVRTLPEISSISGRIVDVRTGVPPYWILRNLPNASAPSVQLIQCQQECIEIPVAVGIDESGRFLVEPPDYFTLKPGGYRVEIYGVAGYSKIYSDVVQIAADQDFDFGDIGLTSDPIFIAGNRACNRGVFNRTRPAPGQAESGSRLRNPCRYSARIFNNTDRQLSGLVWSTVNGSFGLANDGEPQSRVTFEASAGNGSLIKIWRRRITIPPWTSRIVPFQFEIPQRIDEQAEYCTELFFGRYPDPLYSDVIKQPLFCISNFR